MIDLFIARQPIFDSSMELFGYELLYRSDESNYANIVDPNQATAHTVTLGLVEIGLENLVGKHKAFINLSPDYILGSPDLPFPSDKVVLEITEDDLSTKDMPHTLERLSKNDYTIALNGLHSSSRSLELLSVADIVKIDISKQNSDELKALVANIKKHPVKLIAEKVEDGSQVKELIDMGFDYLQGFFFSRPLLSKQSSLSTNQLAMMDILSKVYNPDITIEELEEAIIRDVTLSYHLLRYLNSAFFSLPNPLDSIRQAVIYLGRNSLKTWVTVISMADHNSKPGALITTALARAKFCESIARAAEQSNTDGYFSVGLLSVLDALMDQPILEIVSKLPLNNDLKTALTHHTGDIGSALNAILMLEQEKWDNIYYPNISKAALNLQYRSAIQWADDVSRNLGV